MEYGNLWDWKSLYEICWIQQTARGKKKNIEKKRYLYYYLLF